MSAKEIEKRIQQKSKLKWDYLEATEKITSISKKTLKSYLKKQIHLKE
jgi:hypothetical protein